MYNKLGLNKLLPPDRLAVVICCFIWNSMIYSGTRLFNGNLIHHDMTTWFDDLIPVVPEFMLIYFGCFAFWIIYFLAVSRTGSEACYKIAAMDILGKTICAVIFILWPTTNARPDVPVTDVATWLLNWLYSIDPADNLFPSIHCLVSWECFVGIRGLKERTFKTKLLGCVVAILVFISTLVTKQHVIADVISAVLLAELCWFISNKFKLYIVLEKAFEKIFGNSRGLGRIKRKR